MINPKLIDVLDRLKINIFESLNCVGIGIVESVKGSRAQLSMAYKTRRVTTDENGNEKTEPVDYPALVDCPIFRISGGKSGLYVPIKKGDVCVILFNDVDMDNFITSKNIAIPDTRRSHSFSDAIALVGIENEIQEFGEDIALYNQGASLAIGGGKLSIKNDSFNMLEILIEMLGVIRELRPLSASPGNPSNPNPADEAKAVLLENKITGLLK